MTNSGSSELERFHQFIGRQLLTPSGVKLSPEDALELFRLEPLTFDDLIHGPDEVDSRSTVSLEGLDKSFLEKLRSTELK